MVLDHLGDEGEAVSTQHPTVVLSNDSLAVGLVASNGTGTNLEVWIYDGSTLSRHNITNHTDVNSELQLSTLTNGSLLLASLTTDGTLSVHELWPEVATGTNTRCLNPAARPTNTASTSLEAKNRCWQCVETPFLLLGMNETGHWTTLAERPAAAVDGAWMWFTWVSTSSC